MFGTLPSWHGVQAKDNNFTYVRFEAFTAIKIQVEVFWVVMPCSIVVG